MTTTSKVSGIVQIDGTPANRKVRAFGYSETVHTIDGGEVTLSKSLGHATSDSTTGEYTIDLLGGYGREVFVVAFDDYGAGFAPELALNVGDRIHPSTPNGHVWEATGAGTLPAEEPAWVVDTETSQTYGTAAMIARPFYRPMVHGPVAPEVTSTGGNQIPTDELIAHYKFDDSSDVGRDETGLMPATPRNISTSNDGKFGLSLNPVYNGNQSYLELPIEFFDLIKNAGTISAWIKIEPGRLVNIFSGRSKNNSTRQNIYVLDSGAAFFNEDAGTTSQTASGIINVGVWTHVAFVWGSSSGRKVFVDGVEAGLSNSAAAWSYPSQGPGAIGAGWYQIQNNISTLYGKIDQMRVYSRALTPLEVIALASES